MPAIIQCPCCRAPLRIPDRVGERRLSMRCPKCKTVIPNGSDAPKPFPIIPPQGEMPPRAEPKAQTQMPRGAMPLTYIDGIPVGILVRDDAFVVPLAPHERVAPPNSHDRDAHAADHRFLAHDLDTKRPESDAEPVPLGPPPNTSVYGADEFIDSEDVELVDVDEGTILDAGELEIVGAPLAEPPRPPAKLSSRLTVSDHLSERELKELTRAHRGHEWNSVRLGLFLIYTSACLVLGAYDTVLAGMVVSQLLWLCGATTVGAGTLVAAFVIGGIIGVGSAIASVVGHVFCCFAPPRRGVQTLAVVCAALLGLSAVGYLASYLVLLAGSPVLYVLMLMGAALMGIAHPFVFLFFLRALALAIKKRWLADDIRNLIIGLAISLVAYPLFAFLVSIVAGAVGVGIVKASGAAALKNSATMVGTFGFAWIFIAIVGFILSVALFVWFMKCLVATLDDVEQASGRTSSAGNPVWMPLLTGAGVCFALLIIVSIVSYMLAPETPKSMQGNEPVQRGPDSRLRALPG